MKSLRGSESQVLHLFRGKLLHRTRVIVTITRKNIMACIIKLRDTRHCMLQLENVLLQTLCSSFKPCQNSSIHLSMSLASDSESGEVKLSGKARVKCLSLSYKGGREISIWEMVSASHQGA